MGATKVTVAMAADPAMVMVITTTEIYPAIR
jgi:hypothetical protein